MLHLMVLMQIENADDLVSPVLIAALDGWVDAGSAATRAAALVAANGTRVATFDDDRLYDYRARRPTLEIVDGRPATLTWPELVVRRSRIGERDVLVLTGPEPDFHWRELTRAAVELAHRLDVAEWISLGAIPAAVPHTRGVPIMGTESAPGLLRADVMPGPEGDPARARGGDLRPRSRGGAVRHPGRRLLRPGAPLRDRRLRPRRGGAPPRAGATPWPRRAPGRAPRGVAPGASPGWTRRPLPTRGPVRTSNGWRPPWTRHAARRAMT